MPLPPTDQELVSPHIVTQTLKTEVEVCNRRNSKEFKSTFKQEDRVLKARKRFDLLNARAKSSMDSLIPIDNMIPPRAGAYNSFDTLHLAISKSKIMYLLNQFP